MRSTVPAVLLLALLPLTGGCFTSAMLLHPQQRPLIHDLMQQLQTGQRQLQDSLKQNRWEAIERISGEMMQSAQRLQNVEPTKAVEDFRIRGLELEHDLSLIWHEARLQNDKAISQHLYNMQFTCDSCHRKFEYGRPW